MNNSKWGSLEDKSIVAILDGDSEVGTINLDGKQFPLKMSYLSGFDICDLSEIVDARISYYDQDHCNKSRWEYFYDVLDKAIENNRVWQLLNYIFDKRNLRKYLEQNLNSRRFEEIIPKIQAQALAVINEILYTQDLKLVQDGQKWEMHDIRFDQSAPARENNDITVQTNVDSNGFYILPFRKDHISVMHAIQDELKDEHIPFEINKSGDILDPSEGTNILKNIWTDIKDAPLLIADISGKNPNVFYELGIARALDKKVIVICSKESRAKDYNKGFPFDISTGEIITYNNDDYDGYHKLARKVVKSIQALLTGTPVRMDD